MRIVLDTNVFISGIFFSGPPAKILRAWKDSKLKIVLSKEIIEEYHRVAISLEEKFPSVEILPIIELVAIHGLFIDTKGFETLVCDDPDDNNGIHYKEHGEKQKPGLPA